ncbi:MAG: glycosyltransferase [Bacilli bacterium]|nr:glycosyltransferase [Bacilli bacterium]
MKKVLFVFNHPAPYKVRLLNKLADFLDLTVIFERDINKDRQKDFYFENKHNFKQVFIKGRKLGNENFISNGLVKHLKKNKYNLVIMNGYSTFAEMKAIKYLKKHKINYCLYINGGIIKKNESKFKKKLKTKYISGANMYMSPDSNSNEYLNYYGANKDLIFNYTYSTIYESEILKSLPSKEEMKKTRDEKGITAEYVYVSCGQLIPRKNYFSLVENWPSDENKQLLIIGEGPQITQIENYLKNNPSKNVKLLGFLKREEIFSYYRLSDAFIFPSLEDIYGHVINEALSQGLPIISSTNINSSRKLIKENINGLFLNCFNQDNINFALDAIKKLDKTNSLKTAKENTIEIMVNDHKKILL